MRKQFVSREAASIARQRRLLIALSDDLTLPLLQIRSTLDILESLEDPASLKAHVAQMNASADAGLYLAEAYRLVLLSNKLSDLPTEPVAIGAILDEVAHQLEPFAKQYDTKIQIDIQGKLNPVLAHQPSLLAALKCLSTSLVKAQSAQYKKDGNVLLLGAHRSLKNTVAAGAFSNTEGLSEQTLRAARSLIGVARQPLPALPAGAASGILLADLLCSNLWQPLRSAAHKNLGGLVVGVPASKQLQFV